MTLGVTPPIPPRIRKQVKALVPLKIVIALSVFTGTTIALSSPTTTGREANPFGRIGSQLRGVLMAGEMKQRENPLDDN